MDEFAQTRELDNLFDDDFTPLIETTGQRPRPQDHQPQPRPRGSNSQPEPTPNNALVSEDQTTANTTTTTSNEQNTASRPISAVRGDRSATGGINKPKLTETELSARLAAVKLNNARREEAHRLAEADEASFQEREAQASQKRREEGVARKAMEGEREKNRMRKLSARGGREWDEGKEEHDSSSPRASHYRRGAHGGVTSGGRNNDGYEDDRQGNRDRDREEMGRGFNSRGGGRGRGDRYRGERGSGRGGYRGRGSHHADEREPQARSFHHSTAPGPNNETEFPALPFTNPPLGSLTRSKQSHHPRTPSPSPGPNERSTTATTPGAATTSLENPANPNNSWQNHPEPFSPVAEKESWSDQVETQTPASGW